MGTLGTVEGEEVYRISGEGSEHPGKIKTAEAIADEPERCTSWPTGWTASGAGIERDYTARSKPATAIRWRAS